MEWEHTVGDFVTYKQNGICKICSTVKRDFAGMGEREYFELRPVYDEKTDLFIPKDSQSLTGTMRHILTKDEINKIIDESQTKEVEWIKDAKERAKAFEAVIEEGDRKRILSIIKVLSLHKAELDGRQKKMYASDSRILALAERIIDEEFAFVLDIDRACVREYIMKRLEKERT